MTKFIKDESGQGMLEYVLIIALVALIAVIALVAVKTFLGKKNEQIESQLTSVDALS